MMDNNNIKKEIKRLVDEANVIAPSISRVHQGNYGNVTDEEFDFDSFISWEMEAKAILLQLSKSDSEIFSDLYNQYVSEKTESQKWHSKSILAHKIQQLLIAAFTLIDSPITKIHHQNDLRRKNEDKIEKGYAFIAMPIDPEDHELVDILEAVKEAALKCGIRAERVDELHTNEKITDKIVESIQKAEYVIVDLSKSKPNVCFEAGFAHGLGKTPIYFAKNGSNIEFDLKDYPVLFYRNYKELKASIENRIQGLKANNQTSSM